MARGPGGGQDGFLAHRYYYYVLAVFAVATAVMWVIVHSPFGKALQAIRDNEVRAEFVGVQVRRYRYVAFLVSGAFTGLAGALWVPLNGLTTPDILYWPFSGRIVFMVVLGGFRTFWGPIVGAFVYNYLEVWAVGATVYWQLVLGVILVTLVLAMPTGLVGTAGQLVARCAGAAGREPARDPEHHEDVRGQPGGRRRHADDPEGRVPGPDRVERGGQDDAGEPDQRLLPADRGPSSSRGTTSPGTPSTGASAPASRAASSW